LKGVAEVKAYVDAWRRVAGGDVLLAFPRGARARVVLTTTGREVVLARLDLDRKTRRVALARDEFGPVADLLELVVDALLRDAPPATLATSPTGPTQVVALPRWAGREGYRVLVRRDRWGRTGWLSEGRGVGLSLSEASQIAQALRALT
jgi:hypothetical protein